MHKYVVENEMESIMAQCAKTKFHLSWVTYIYIYYYRMPSHVECRFFAKKKQPAFMTATSSRSSSNHKSYSVLKSVTLKQR